MIYCDKPWEIFIGAFNISPPVDCAGDWIYNLYIQCYESCDPPQRPSCAIFLPNTNFFCNYIRMFLMIPPYKSNEIFLILR